MLRLEFEKLRVVQNLLRNIYFFSFRKFLKNNNKL